MNSSAISTAISTRRAALGLIGLGTAGLVLLRWPAEAAAKQDAVRRSEAEWRRLLGPERFRILRQAGTERAFSSPLDKEKRKGLFRCAGCSQPLFASATKFDSGTGWPSFYRPLQGSIVTRTDRELGMVRTEVLCSRCGGHLGHVFEDGPRPTGLRYCMNGLALRFQPA